MSFEVINNEKKRLVSYKNEHLRINIPRDFKNIVNFNFKGHNYYEICKNARKLINTVIKTFFRFLCNCKAIISLLT